MPFTDLRITRWADPERGDVVTFNNPVDGRLFIKRVVAVPGDEVKWRNNQLLVNGERATYTPLQPGEIRKLPIEDPGRFHFYRENLLGVSRIVMLHNELGRRDVRGDLLAALAGRTRTCEQYEAVAASANPALAAAICRCGERGTCSTFPSFVVPPGK